MRVSPSTGYRATGERKERIAASPQWDGKRFNPGIPREEPPFFPTLGKMLTTSRKLRSPSAPIPLVSRHGSEFVDAPTSGLRVTWLGHSTTLIEIGGRRILLDPVFGQRVSPFTWTGPKRFHESPLPLDHLPPLDAIVISHDHYDHLDYPTILHFRQSDVPFVTSLGVGAHLQGWGIPPERIIELDWWEDTMVGEVRVTATPARHFSGRAVNFSDREQTLWSGMVLTSADHRVFFTGDTALFTGFTEIGERLGPFDLMLLETGAYNPLWKDVHIGPEQGALAAKMARAKAVLPVHWGTFDLALHNWTEPVERLLIAANKLQLPVTVPRLGQSIVIGEELPKERWWPEVEYLTALESPLISSSLPDDLLAQVQALCT